MNDPQTPSMRNVLIGTLIILITGVAFGASVAAIVNA
jgi:hypothetical protein